MKVPLLLTVLLITCALPGKAQDTLPQRFTTVYWEPFALLDIYNDNSIRIGAEYNWCRRWGIYGTVGMYTWEGYIIRAGIKWNFLSDKWERHGIALDLMHAWHDGLADDNKAILDSASPDGANPGPDFKYGYTKNVSVISLVYYYETCFKRYFTVRFYTGVGIKYRDAEIGISQSEQDGLYHYEYGGGMIDPATYSRGNYATANIMCGVTLGYLLPLRKKTKGPPR